MKDSVASMKNSLSRFLTFLNKRNIAIVLTGCCCLLLQSCYNYYGPAMAGKEFLAQSKPHHQDSNSVEYYVSGHAHYGGEFASGEENLGFDISAYRSENLDDWATTSLGVYGFYGEYTTKPYGHVTPQARTYYGIGANGDVFVNLPLGRFDWRVAGIKASFSQEFGPFTRFRKNFTEPNDPQLTNYHDIARNGRIFSIAGASELLIKVNQDVNIGIGTYMGTSYFSPEAGDLEGGVYLSGAFRRIDFHLMAASGFYRNSSLVASFHIPFSNFK